jgi:PAS domain S-box-containing protein
VAEEGRVDVAVTVAGTPVAVLAVWPQPALDPTAFAFHVRVAEVLSASLARAAREARLRNRERHFIEAQRISHVGSYDFDITANTNEWSDELYRIYGREPGSFMATYERFLELVHPDDRETIMGVHRHAMETLSPYEMEERIVWPDGDVRTLASWGEVVADADGNPARMVGICWDITKEKETAAALQESSRRFQQLIESAPDVVLVTDAQGHVMQANQRLEQVLGWEPAELVGRAVRTVLPGGLVSGETTARHRSGQDIPVDISTSEVPSPEGAVTAVFVRDVTERRHAEDLALRLHDNDVRRRHALEINDNVVQGLASVLYLLDLARVESAHAAARQTLTAARAMMNGLLTETEENTLLPGELVREHGHVGMLDEAPPAAADAPDGALRVLLADDADDIRLLLRYTLSVDAGCVVVGEAANGAEAVALTEELRPDVVVLDLSMPVMDGLQAIPELLRVHPDVRILVLSGFDEGRMRMVALELGAHAYIEKGEATSSLVETLSALFPTHRLGQPSPVPADPDSAGGLAFDGDMVVHELRTPLTVINGMLTTLRDRMDVLPSATTQELVQAALRNTRQMADLLDVVSDARRAEHGVLSVVPEPTDVGRLVRHAVADLCSAHGWAPAQVETAVGAVASVDPVRIRQALANLLSNAYKVSPRGAPVRVDVSVAGDTVEVAVSDDGPGVPAQRRAELFGRFARLGQSGPGMGLGLYISREIARAHGGDLRLVDGPGATFVLALPLQGASVRA